MTDRLPPVGSWLIPEWRERHPKLALGCDLIVELGFDPDDVLSRTSVRDVLDIEGDRCIRILVLDRNARGGIHYGKQPHGTYDVAHHVEFVDVDPERLAKYRADIEALSEPCCDDENYDTCQCKHHEAAGDPVVEGE